MPRTFRVGCGEETEHIGTPQYESGKTQIPSRIEQITDFDPRFVIEIYQGRHISDLCCLAPVAELEPYNLHGVPHISWVRSVLSLSLIHI